MAHIAFICDDDCAKYSEQCAHRAPMYMASKVLCFNDAERKMAIERYINRFPEKIVIPSPKKKLLKKKEDQHGNR